MRPRRPRLATVLVACIAACLLAPATVAAKEQPPKFPTQGTDALAKGVPVVSGTANSADWYTKAGMFPTGTDIGSGIVAQMAVAAQRIGHRQEAIGYFEEVLRRSPGHPKRGAILAQIKTLRAPAAANP